jgi:hypothetical protein
MRRRLGVALALSALAVFVLGGAERAVAADTLTITAPGAMTVTADRVCGQLNCAQVFYTFTVSGGYPPYQLVCTPVNSGGLFLVGAHTVSCLAQDSADDSTPYASFAVTVVLPGTGAGGAGSGGGGGTSGGGETSGGGGSTGSGGSGGVSSTNPLQANEAVSLGGAPRVGHRLTVHVLNGRPRHYVWQLERAGRWRPLLHEAASRLVVTASYAGGRLRVRVTLSNGRVLYSPRTAPVRR